jgi:hypothetical protein
MRLLLRKEEAKKWLEEHNKLLEPICQEEWELAIAMRRLNVRRNTARPKPQWRWTEQNGKLVRKAERGGID